MTRLNKVRQFRLASKKQATIELADTPSLFAEIRQPEEDYVFIPLHTSENRKYIPFAFLKSNNILHNSCSAIPNASLFDFGVIISSMHMAWIKTVCGRIKSDFRYSNKLVYNNFPWPKNISSNDKEKISIKAKEIIDIRGKYENVSLSDLYNPLSMPNELVKAHKELDAIIDKCYRKKKFTSDLDRIILLFDLFQ